MVVSAFVITGSGFAAVAVQAIWPLFFGIASALVFCTWHWHRIALEPLLPELVSEARKTEAMGALALLVAALLN